MAERSLLSELNAAVDESGGFVLVAPPGGTGNKFADWLCQSLDSRLDVQHRSWTPGEPGSAAAIFTRAGSQADLPELELTSELAARCAKEHFGLSADAADELVSQLGGATCLYDELDFASATETEDGRLDQRLEAAVRAAPRFRSDYRALVAHGGNRLLDLGRAMYLLAPDAMHLGDEWTEIASASSGRNWSLSDASQVLSEYGELFEMSVGTPPATVRSRDAYCQLLLAGLIPASASEYYKLFSWMLARSVDSLRRVDEGDSFIRRSLPRVAAKAGVLEELLTDGQAMLASDIESLVTYLEAEPELMTLLGSKAILLHAHRLGNDVDQREAQMEFALRRLGLSTEADQLEDVVPPRSWRPSWSSTRPVNVHRVLCEVGSSAISMAFSGVGRRTRVYVGFGNGRVIQARIEGKCSTISTTEASESEVRAVAVAALDATDFVATAASDSGVRAYRVRDEGVGAASEMLWAEFEGLEDPLSAVGIAHVDGAPRFVLAAGVKGRLWKHDLVSGVPLGSLIDWGAEIRTIRTLEVDGRSIAVVAAVDGRVGVIDCETGEEIAVTNVETLDNVHEAALTPICIDAVAEDDQVCFLVGCATGHVIRGTWSHLSGFELEELRNIRVPLASANSVKLIKVDGELASYVARSDGVWIRHRANADHSVLARVGHAGPILSLSVTRDPVTEEVIVLTGGSEGAVRVWRHSDAVMEKLGHLRVNRHRGAVTSLAIRAVDDEVEIATGGADADVRLWRRSDPATSQVMRDQGGEIASVLWLPAETGARLVVGTADGSVRTASLDESDRWIETAVGSQLIGIAHEGVTSMARGESGQFLSAGADGGVTLWDGDAGVPRASVPVFEFGAVTALIQHGPVLFVAGQDGTLRAVDLRTNAVTKSAWRMSSIVSLARIEPAGDLVVGSSDGAVCSIAASRAIDDLPQRIFQHDAGIESLCTLLVDGEPMIAIAGRDRRVIVVDASTGVERHSFELEGFPNAITAIPNVIGVATTGGATLLEFCGRESRRNELVTSS